MRCDKCGGEIQQELGLKKSDRDVFFEFWEPTLGTEECENSWKAKELMMRRDAPMVMSDLAPYQSMIDGSMITSRSQHRDHLKRHGKIEVGNEVNALMERAKPKPIDTKKRTEMIAAQVYDRFKYGKNGLEPR